MSTGVKHRWLQPVSVSPVGSGVGRSVKASCESGNRSRQGMVTSRVCVEPFASEDAHSTALCETIHIRGWQASPLLFGAAGRREPAGARSAALTTSAEELYKATEGRRSATRVACSKA